MSPRNAQREKLYADLPAKTMRMIDAMCEQSDFTRTQMVMMCVEDRFNLWSTRQRKMRPVASEPEPLAQPANVAEPSPFLSYEQMNEDHASYFAGHEEMTAGFAKLDAMGDPPWKD